MMIRAPRPFLGALLLLVGAGHSLAAQEAMPPKAANPAAQADPGPKKRGGLSTPKGKGVPEAAKPRTGGKLKLVDINSATKEEISFMLKIDAGTAAKIVAGRPYLSKSKLVTKNVLSKETYFAIKDRIVAKQRPSAK